LILRAKHGKAQIKYSKKPLNKNDFKPKFYGERGLKTAYLAV